jgi:hypothetical protein
MIGMIGANVAGNIIAAPLVNGLAASQSPVPVLPPEPVPYAYESSNAGGVYIGVDGKTKFLPSNPLQPIKGEPVYAAGSGSFLPTLTLTTSNPLTPAVEAADPNAADQSGKVEAEQQYSPDMNQAMLLGAVAGAIVAKYSGFHVLLGAGAGALVGHFYAGGQHEQR